jgi:hypothetical protein
MLIFFSPMRIDQKITICIELIMTMLVIAETKKKYLTIFQLRELD